MLGGDEVILEFGGLGLGGVEGLLERLTWEDIGGTGAGDFHAAAQFGLKVGGEAGQGDTELLEELRNEALGLLREGEQEVVAIHFLMRAGVGELLRGLEGFLSFGGEFFSLHKQEDF